MRAPPSFTGTKAASTWDRPPTSWNGDASPDEGPAIRPGDVVRGGVALDRDGRRLAAVVEDAAGINRIATFVRGGEGWEPDVRLAAPPGSYGGRLAWLP